MQITPLLAPLKGLHYNIAGTLVDDLEMTDCRNVYIDKYSNIKKIEGYIAKGNNLPLHGSIMLLDQFFKTDGTEYLIAVTTTNAYFLNPTTLMWELITDGTEVSDCETVWTASTNVTATIDSTYKVKDSYSAKLAIADAFTTGLAAYKDISSINISSRTALHFWIRSSKATSAGDLQVGVSETAGMGGTPVWFDVPALEANKWTACCVDGTFTDLDAVVSVGLKVMTDLGAMDVYLDDIVAVTRFTGDEDNLFFAEIMSDLFIVTNYTDNIKKWTGLGKMTDLGGSPPKAKYIKKYKDYLVLGYINSAGTAYPQRIQWSDTGAPETWSGGNAGYQDLIEGVDWITGMDLLGDRIVVFKERSIYSGYLVATSEIFNFDLKISGVGLPAGAAIGSIGDELIFPGWDNIYIFDGITIEDVGSPIKDEFLSLINSRKIGNCHCLVIEELDEYHLFVPSVTNTYPDLEWVYNYINKAWFRNSRTNITRGGYYTRQSSLTIDEMTGTIDEQTGRFDDRIYLSASPTNLLGDSSGYIYEWDYTTNDEAGSAIDGWFTTKDFTMNRFDVRKYWSRLDVYGAGNSVTVDYSTDEGDTWTNLGTLTLTAEFDFQKLDFRVTSEKIRFRFRNNSSGETFKIRKLVLYWEFAGRI